MKIYYKQPNDPPKTVTFLALTISLFRLEDFVERKKDKIPVLLTFLHSRRCCSVTLCELLRRSRKETLKQPDTNYKEQIGTVFQEKLHRTKHDI